MQEIMLRCFSSVSHKLERKLGYFDLLGFDFMLDENFKVKFELVIITESVFKLLYSYDM